ncbi:hypothetical protein QYE76_018766 [Lolium multiflorum]|uniref:Uncharacterized protein n=1 Tax=Lolium multiflorum TaxID=4521 RepID=A0AAD8PZ57_LOLMU|nr:hypothetical protein QYE76_018766 [Lolium multiflorum]
MSVQEEGLSPPTSKEALPSTPKRKRREGKGALVESEVSEETVDKNILKKHKASDGDNKTMVPPGVIGQKKSSNATTSSKAKPIEKKGKNKPAAIEQLAKKKTPK